MDVNGRIRHLMKERNWTEYRLAKMAGLSASTLSNLFTRNTTPSINTLEAICKGFGITLGQFFTEGEVIELSKEQKEFFDEWVTLTADEKELVKQITRKFKCATGAPDRLHRL